MKVSYKVLDLAASDWIEVVRESNCDAFLALPATLLTSMRHLSDERLRVLTEDMKKLLSPSYAELWLWESKRRMRDWLVAHNVPHPRTDVFYDLEDALAFVDAADYPLVCKTNVGATASGVFVLRDRRAAIKVAREAFGRGILPRGWDRRNRERGCVIFQEFVPHDHEWRIVRIGDDYLCRRKARVGDFASGTGHVEWVKPSGEMLSFVEEITNRGGFTSMGVDFFVVPRGGGRDEFLVNELQCLVGVIAHPEIRNADTGKWHREGAGWRFEPGFFYQNACMNLRIAHVLRVLAKQRGLVLTTPAVVLPE